MFSQLKAIKALGWRSVLRAQKIKRLSQETIRGFYATRSIIALLNIGLFDELAGQHRINLAAFAVRENLDPKVLKSLCDYLYELKILNRNGENYSLTQPGSFLVETLSGPLQSVYAYEDVFHNLEALLKKEKRYGLDVNRRGEFVARGSGSTGKLLVFPLVAELLSQNKFERILDLGCGDGAFLIDLCERDGRMRGYGLDISPEAIAAGQRKLSRKNLQHRLQLLVGDIFELDDMADRLQGIDAATCIYVLHEFLTDDREQILDLLDKFKRTFPGVPLIVCEVIRHTPEALRKKPGGIMEIQLFHDLSNQQLASREEWQDLFKGAGFTKVQENYLSFVRTAIYTIS